MDSYVTFSDLTYDDAHTSAGLTINDVGRSYFLLNGAGPTDRQTFDYMLRIGGDLTRFRELKTLMLRLIENDAHNATVLGLASQFWNQNDDDDGWYDYDDYDAW